MTSKLRPMLADNKVKLDETNLHTLRYPLYVSPKYDGIRLRVDPDLGAVSRTHKPIPNEYIQSVVKRHIHWMRFLDGEVIVGDPVAPDVFNKTQSAVMTQGDTPRFTYYVFDSWGMSSPFIERNSLVEHIVKTYELDDGNTLVLTPQTLVYTPQEVLYREAQYLEVGFEGIMLRDPNSPYKNNRSTFLEQYLLKLKRMDDAEATVIGFQALERNHNVQVQDVFGLAKRSSHKAGRLTDDLLGALLVEHASWGQFSIGSGFDEDTRIAIWQNQADYLGRSVSFKYQPYGSKDKPRFPIFKGFRND